MKKKILLKILRIIKIDIFLHNLDSNISKFITKYKRFEKQMIFALLEIESDFDPMDNFSDVANKTK